MSEKQANKKEPVIGTSDMPPVQTVKYETFYRISQLFINDLKIVMQDAPYADVRQLFSFLENYNFILPAAILNEFLNKIASMPYRLVAPIMEVIENKNLFPKYFEDVTAQVVKQQSAQQPAAPVEKK